MPVFLTIYNPPANIFGLFGKHFTRPRKVSGPIGKQFVAMRKMCADPCKHLPCGSRYLPHGSVISPF